jgi:chromosome segregation ATPase
LKLGSKAAYFDWLVICRFFAYLLTMDERAKSIVAIERKAAGEVARVDGLLRGLGQKLLERSQDGEPAGERAVYDGINDEKARLDDALRQIEVDLEEINDINGKIAEAERQNGEVEARLVAIYPNLGKLAVRDEAFAVFAAPYKTRIAVVQQKIDALAEQIDGADAGLESRTDARGVSSVFTWVGRNVKTLVSKSALAKSEIALERIYGEVGADFACNRPPAGQMGTEETEEAYTSARRYKDERDERSSQIAALRERKRNIQNTFGPDGNANRKKTEIGRRRDHLDRELGDLYLQLGQKAEAPVTRPLFASLFDDEMSEIRGNIAYYRHLIKDYEDQVSSLKASLEIDGEREEIEKFKRSIADQRQRIAAAEAAIAQYDKRIEEANRRIMDLTSEISPNHT